MTDNLSTERDTRRRIAHRAVTTPDPGPSLRALPFGITSTRKLVQLLSNTQRLQLLGISTRLRLPARKILYRKDSPAEWLFIVADGVLKSFRDLPSGKRRVLAFLFAKDIFGLAECGLFVNTVQSVTPVTVYRIRVELLMEKLRADSDLELQFLNKVTHELRESMRRTILVARRDAVGRLAMFLRMLENHGEHRDSDSRISIPMSRSDIANFVGLSLEAVIRAAHRLERTGIVTFDGLRAARVRDRRRFEELASGV